MAVVQIPTSASGYQQSVVTQANAAQRAVNRMTMAPTLSSKGITQPLGKITASASEFQKSMDASAARVFAFGAAVGIINGISNAFKNMVNSAREVEKALKDVQVVMNATNAEITKFGQGLFDVAKNTASSFETVSESAIELARQGLGAEETLKRVNSALILSRLSGLGAVKSTETLTAAINSFNKEGITHEQVVNRMANVDAAFAVSSKDLAEAISRAGAVAQSSGVSFNELAAIVTAVQQRTARGGSVIGNGFKSIFTRIKRSRVRESLEQIGVATKDLNGNFRSGISILKDYADVYKTLSDTQKSYTSEQIAGVFQIQNLQALIQDLGSGYSVYNRSLKVANDTTNEAIVRNEKLNQTLDAIFKSTTLSAKQLGATLGEIALSDNFKNILQFLGNLADGLNNLFDEKTGSDFARNLVKGIGAFITGPGLVILGAAFIKLFALIGKFAKDAFKDLLGLNLESKRQAGLQAAITAALSKNDILMKSMVAAGSSQAKQEQVILNFIRLETTERLKQETILKRIAGSGVLRGIGASEAGFVAGGRRASRKIGRKTLGIAGGFIPSFNEESRNIRKGVGGARSGDQPVGVTVGLGGGKKMNAIAHTGEWRVPWGGGSEAIFNRDMAAKFGLPKGSKKITVGDGFVPNFAKTKQPSASSRATTLDFSRLVTMLIPQKSNKGFATSRWKDASGGMYNIKFQVRGPDASAVKRVDPMINKMANAGILSAAGKAANKLGLQEFKPGPGPKSLSNSELAVTKGRIFEVATARVLKAPTFIKDQATFDMMNPDTNRTNLFNWDTPFADAKTGPQHAKSVAKKIVKFFGSGGGKGRAMGAKPIRDLMAQIDKDQVKGFRGKQAERSRLSILNRLSDIGIDAAPGQKIGGFGRSMRGQKLGAGLHYDQAKEMANYRQRVLGTNAGGFIPNFAPFNIASLDGRQIGRLKAGNTLNINGKHLGVKDLSSKDQTALLGHQSKTSKAATAAAASKKEELKSRQLIDASRYATMLVATRNHRAKVDRAVDRGKNKYRVKFRVEGIKEAGLIGEKKIRQRVRDVLVKESNRAARDMVGPGDFAKNLPVMTNVMNAGALGGAAGTVFETALQAIQGNKLFKDNDNNARFDIQGFPNRKLGGIFGYHTQLGEAKISDTSDQRTSMINKIISQRKAFRVKPTGGKGTYGKQKVAAKIARGRAGGFIPSFARGGFGLSAYRKRIGEESRKVASTSGLRYGKALSRREFMGSGAENLVFAGRKNVFKVNPGTLRGGQARDVMGNEGGHFQKHISSSSNRARNFNKYVSKRYPALFSPRTKGFKMGKGTLNVQGRVKGPTLQDMVDRKMITEREALMLANKIRKVTSDATRKAGYPRNYPLADSALVNFVIPQSKVRAVIRSLRGYGAFGRESRKLRYFPRKSIAAIDVAKGFVPNFSDKGRAMKTEREMGGNPGYRKFPFPHVYDKDTQPTWQQTFSDHKKEGLGTAIQNSYQSQMGMSNGFTPNLASWNAGVSRSAVQAAGYPYTKAGVSSYKMSLTFPGLKSGGSSSPPPATAPRPNKEPFWSGSKGMTAQMGMMFMGPMIAEQIKSTMKRDGSGGEGMKGAAAGMFTGLGYGAMLGPWGMLAGGLAGAGMGAIGGDQKTMQPIVKSFEKLAITAAKASDSINLTATAFSGLHEATLSGDVEKMQTAQEKLQESLRKVVDPELASRLRDVTTGTASFSEKIAELNRLFDESENKKKTAAAGVSAFELLKKKNKESGVMDFDASGIHSTNPVMRGAAGFAGFWNVVYEGVSGLLSSDSTFKEGAIKGVKQSFMPQMSKEDMSEVGEKMAEFLLASGVGKVSATDVIRDQVNEGKKRGVTEDVVARNIMKSLGMGGGLKDDFGMKDLKKDQTAMSALTMRDIKHETAVLAKDKAALTKLIKRMGVGGVEKDVIDQVKKEFLNTAAGSTLQGKQKETFENLGQANAPQIRNTIMGVLSGIIKMEGRISKAGEFFEGLTDSTQDFQDEIGVAVAAFKKLTEFTDNLSLALDSFAQDVEIKFAVDKILRDSKAGTIRSENQILESVGAITPTEAMFRDYALQTAELRVNADANLNKTIFGILNSARDAGSFLEPKRQAVLDAQDTTPETLSELERIAKDSAESERQFTEDFTRSFSQLASQTQGGNIQLGRLLNVTSRLGHKDAKMQSKSDRLNRQIRSEIRKNRAELIAQTMVLKEANRINQLRTAAANVNRFGTDLISGQAITGIRRDLDAQRGGHTRGSRESGAQAAAGQRLREFFTPEVYNLVTGRTGLDDKEDVILANLKIMFDSFGETGGRYSSTGQSLVVELEKALIKSIKLLRETKGKNDSYFGRNNDGQFFPGMDKKYRLDPVVSGLEGVLTDTQLLAVQGNATAKDQLTELVKLNKTFDKGGAFDQRMNATLTQAMQAVATSMANKTPSAVATPVPEPHDHGLNPPSGPPPPWGDGKPVGEHWNIPPPAGDGQYDIITPAVGPPGPSGGTGDTGRRGRGPWGSGPIGKAVNAVGAVTRRAYDKVTGKEPQLEDTADIFGFPQPSGVVPAIKTWQEQLKDMRSLPKSSRDGPLDVAGKPTKIGGEFTLKGVTYVSTAKGWMIRDENGKLTDPGSSMTGKTDRMKKARVATDPAPSRKTYQGGSEMSKEEAKASNAARRAAAQAKQVEVQAKRKEVWDKDPSVPLTGPGGPYVPRYGGGGRAPIGTVVGGKTGFIKKVPKNFDFHAQYYPEQEPSSTGWTTNRAPPLSETEQWKRFEERMDAWSKKNPNTEWGTGRNKTDIEYYDRMGKKAREDGDGAGVRFWSDQKGSQTGKGVGPIPPNFNFGQGTYRDALRDGRVREAKKRAEAGRKEQARKNEAERRKRRDSNLPAAGSELLPERAQEVADLKRAYRPTPQRLRPGGKIDLPVQHKFDPPGERAQEAADYQDPGTMSFSAGLTKIPDALEGATIPTESAVGKIETFESKIATLDNALTDASSSIADDLGDKWKMPRAPGLPGIDHNLPMLEQPPTTGGVPLDGVGPAEKELPKLRPPATERVPSANLPPTHPDYPSWMQPSGRPLTYDVPTDWDRRPKSQGEGRQGSEPTIFPDDKYMSPIPDEWMEPVIASVGAKAEEAIKAAKDNVMDGGDKAPVSRSGNKVTADFKSIMKAIQEEIDHEEGGTTPGIPDSQAAPIPVEVVSPLPGGDPASEPTGSDVFGPLLEDIKNNGVKVTPEAFGPVTDQMMTTTEVLQKMGEGWETYTANLKNIVYDHGITGNLSVSIDTSVIEKHLGPALTLRLQKLLTTPIILETLYQGLKGKFHMNDIKQ